MVVEGNRIIGFLLLGPASGSQPQASIAVHYRPNQQHSFIGKKNGSYGIPTNHEWIIVDESLSRCGVFRLPSSDLLSNRVWFLAAKPRNLHSSHQSGTESVVE